MPDVAWLMHFGDLLPIFYLCLLHIVSHSVGHSVTFGRQSDTTLHVKVYDLALLLGLTVICQACVQAVVAVFLSSPTELK